MSQFRTVREAKEYLIHRILAQADRDGVPLSDIERSMLYFSETGWTLPNIMTVSQEFDQTYDQDKYETKIGEIVQRAREQPDSNHNDDRWDEAVQRLRDEDHYLLVLIDGATSSPVKRSRWEIVRLILASAGIVAIWLPISFFAYSHVDNRSISGLISLGTLLALAVLVAFLASRGYRESA